MLNFTMTGLPFFDGGRTSANDNANYLNEIPCIDVNSKYSKHMYTKRSVLYRTYEEIACVIGQHT